MSMLVVVSQAQGKPLGNSKAASPSAAAIAEAQSAGQQAERAADAAQNALKRATLAIDAQKATQQVARDAARAALSRMPAGSGIQPGLLPGGLQIGRNPDGTLKLWQGAGNDPIETLVDGRTKVTIKQTQSKAILGWETFNINENTDLRFDQQGNKSWTVLNRVLGLDARPSQILGSITADGSVYVINRSGIIFGGTSQINVGSLTASSFNISNEKFLGNHISTSWDPDGPTFAADPGILAGDVKVKAGARIETTADGRVMLLGGNVTNEGTIATPGGQTLLGAGQQAYLRASTDIDMRGLYIELGQGGTATNSGLIVADRGNITLAGRDVSVGSITVDGVTAAGVLQSKTSVTANGSITLQARDDAFKNTNDRGEFVGWEARRLGIVSIGEGALLEILPDLTDTQMVAATELTAPSAIDLNGAEIYVGKDATLIATGGDIVATALRDPDIVDGLKDDSKIYIEDSAILDVSGTRGVQLAIERNFVEVELRGNELRDNPLLKNSFLYGKKVWIDIRDQGKFEDPLLADVEWFEGEPGVWYGSSLFDASGYIAAIKRGIGELTSKGGSITLAGRGDIALREGSLLNASGGTLEFAGGYGRVTYLTTSGGKVSVGQASPYAQYGGIAGAFTRSSERWGITESWTSPFARTSFYEDGYTEGQRAGTISVVAPSAALDGDILAIAEAGQRQIAKNQVPIGGTLRLGDAATSVDSRLKLYDYVLNSVRLQGNASSLPTEFSQGDALAADHTTILSSERLNEAGIGRLEIGSNGRITVAEDADLDLGDRGSLMLAAHDITVDGKIRAAGGSIDVRGVVTRSEATGSTGGAVRIAIGATAILDAAGLWTNGFADRAAPAPVDGGTIRILTQEITPTLGGVQAEVRMAGTITIDAGAVLDVSGGARVGYDGAIAELGNAGAIAIHASNLALSDAAELRGYGFATQADAGRGGSLSLIGRGVQQHANQDFLGRGGFASYSLDGIDSLVVAAGQQIVLAPQNRLLVGDYRNIASGAPFAALGNLTVLPEGIRARSSLALRAGLVSWALVNGVEVLQNVVGSVEIGAGSLIDVGIGGSVLLAASDLVHIGDGATIRAPGGDISLSLLLPGGQAQTSAPTTSSPLQPYERQDRAIWLGANARLLAQGALLPSWNAEGWRTGEVLAGGRITLDASRAGYVVTEAGSLIDVSGGIAELDLQAHGSDLTGPRNEPLVRSVWSDAGSVSVLARDGAWLDGSYEARAQVPEAEAGRFSLALGASPTQADIDTNILAERTIVVRKNGDPVLPEMFVPGQSLGPAERPAGVGTNIPLQRVPQQEALVSADLLMDAGFGAIALESRNHIAFKGDVRLHAASAIVLNASMIRSDVLADAQSPTIDLAAAYVRLGDASFNRIQYQTGDSTANPTDGPGTLRVNADFLEFTGRTVLGGIGAAEFTSTGDIAFSGVPRTGGVIDDAGNTIQDPITGEFQIEWKNFGTLSAVGDLTFAAAQIYPTSRSTFAIGSTGVGKSIVIRPGNPAAPAPWSVGGKLSISAERVVNEGVLRAPLGEITLGQVMRSRTGRIIAGVEPGVFATDPVTGAVLTLTADSVTLAAGSVVDVSAHGRTQPYGMMINGDWYLQLPGASSDTAPLWDLPEKRVTLAGNSIDIQDGAQIDLSGGGDIMAREFVPGTGGSRDVLTGSGVYAIVPGAQPKIAPSSTTGGSAPAAASSVYLSGVPGLPDGTYTLLPPEYALLPGAFRVQLAGSANDRPAGLMAARADGSYLVAGWHGSTLSGSRDGRNSTFLVMPGNVARTYSEYEISSGNMYFAGIASDAGQAIPPLGIDAGQLILNAIASLNLDGRFNLAAGTGGRGGLVDIASQSIAVVGEGQGPVAGYVLTVDGKALTAMGAQSLLLGGTRRSGTDGDAFNAVATEILITNDEASALVGPEILLLTKSRIAGGVASAGSIVVDDRAVIRAKGAYTGATRPFLIGAQPAEGATPSGTGMGSLLAVSNAPSDLLVRRYDIAGPGGNIAGSIDVRAGALLSAGRSILFDATADSQIHELATVRARSLEIASSTVSFGNAPSGTTGFVANAATLAALASAERLVLRGYDGIHFHDQGSFDIRDPGTGLAAVKELVLDGSALLQRSDGEIRVGAQQLTLRNTGGNAAVSDPAINVGSLVLSADRITVADGQSTIRGFSAATMTSAELGFTGSGGLTAGGSAATDLLVEAPIVVAGNTAAQSLVATGALRMAPGTRTELADLDSRTGSGGRLTIRGDSLAVATGIRLPAGTLTLEAARDLTVAAGALLDVSGRDQAFFDQVRRLPAGSITLSSEAGNVSVLAGAVLDLSDTGEGGTLSVTVPKGSFAIAGEAKGGSFLLDAGSLPSFGAMQSVLNDGGFAVSRSIRLRTGEAVVDGVTKTGEFSLSADEGSITVTGTIDASAKTGGKIKLSAADDIVLDAGSLLTVAGETLDSSGKGGSVLLSAGAHRVVDDVDVTNYDATVDIRLGSRIDLGVADGGGTLHLRLPQVNVAMPSGVTIPGVNITPINGTITGAAKIIVEGYKVYDLEAEGNNQITTALRNRVAVDAEAFAANTALLKQRLFSGGHNQDLAGIVSITPGVELANAKPITDAVVQGVLQPGQTIPIPINTPVILPEGLNGLLTITGSSVNLLETFADGAEIQLTTAKSIGVQNGVAVSFPDGGVITFPAGFSTPGNLTLIRADGTRATVFTSGSTTLQSGDVIIGTDPFHFRAGAGTVRVALPAGRYEMNDANPLVLPPGSRLTPLSRQSATAAVTLQVAAGSTPAPVEFVNNGYQAGSGSSIILSPTAPTSSSLGWDLSGLRFGPDRTPGILTIRAAADVIFGGTLTDGFDVSIYAVSRLIDDASWSYNIVAGADFGAADLMAVRPDFQLPEGVGNVILNPTGAGAVTFNAATGHIAVRTGTGSIAVASSRDIRLHSDRTWRYSSIYTAGRPTQIQPAGVTGTPLADGRIAYGGAFVPTTGAGAFVSAAGGGDVSLSAGGDILGGSRDYNNNNSFSGAQLIASWLPVVANPNPPDADFAVAAAWGANFTKYRDGVAALAGGNVTISAGGDVVSLSAAAANSGLYEGAGADVKISRLGGGDLGLIAGGDVLGGVFYVANGAGVFDVGGSMGGAPMQAINSSNGFGSNGGARLYGTHLALGDATLEVLTRGDLSVAGIYNPTLTTRMNSLGRPDTTQDQPSTAYLLTYGDQSRVSLRSAAGDIQLSDNNLEYGRTEIRQSVFSDSGNQVWYSNMFSYYPGSVEAVAFDGDISIGVRASSSSAKVALLPAANGDLTLLAKDSIDLGGGWLVMSDVDPAVLAGSMADLRPLAWALGQGVSPVRGGDGTGYHADTLYRAQDVNPVRIYAVEGDIRRPVTTAPTNSPSFLASLVLPKPSEIRAGRDIVNLSLIGQNFTDDQTTVISAGRDLTQTKLRRIGGYPASNGIWLGGLGTLEITTGRDLEFGTSFGIETVGDRINPWLPDGQSADIFLGVGFGAQGPDYAGFASLYLAPGVIGAPKSYTEDLVALMRAATDDSTLDEQAAWVQFATLSDGMRHSFIRRIYYQELIRAGENGVMTGNYNDGYAAVATLFPEDRAYGGDLSLRYSQVKSFYAGNIDMLVEGDINAGLAVVGPDIRQPSPTNPNTPHGVKDATQLGIVAQGGGNINIALDGDLIVNQSRVFTMGGNMLIWSSFGDLNAGKGAKTAQVAPPPRLVFNPSTGTFSLELTGAASGSGIGTLITGPGQDPKMWLFAPGGTIDTGDAGIRANDLVIGALEIRGTDNLDVSGAAIGIPSATTDSGTLTSASNTTAANQGDAPQQNTAEEQPSIIIVEVIGFGGGDGGVDDEEERRRRPSQVQ